MRHNVAHRKLGRVTEHRLALLRNQAIALLRHERIETTMPKAKELRPFVERLITIAKRGVAAGDANGKTLHARRMVLAELPDNEVVEQAVRDARAAVRRAAGRLHADPARRLSAAAIPRKSRRSSSSAASTTPPPRSRRTTRAAKTRRRRRRASASASSAPRSACAAARARAAPRRRPAARRAARRRRPRRRERPAARRLRKFKVQRSKSKVRPTLTSGPLTFERCDFRLLPLPPVPVPPSPRR